METLNLISENIENGIVLLLDRVLSAIKISANHIDRATRTALIQNKLELSKVVKSLADYRSSAIKELVNNSEDESREEILKTILSQQLQKSSFVDVQKISQTQFDSILECNELKIDEIELIYNFLIKNNEDGNN